MLNSKLKSIAVIANLNYGILSIRLKRDRIIKERRNHSIFNWMSSCLSLFLFFITECDLRSFVPFPTRVWDVLKPCFLRLTSFHSDLMFTSRKVLKIHYKIIWTPRKEQFCNFNCYTSHSWFDKAFLILITSKFAMK